MQLPSRQSVLYVARDIERALGLGSQTPGYGIISNFSAFANNIAQGRDDIILIKENRPLDTRELLVHPKAIEAILAKTNPRIVVFKHTKQIERICREHGWNMLNPSADLANRVEEKISQIEWLGKLRRFLPETFVSTCQAIEWRERPFILQFNRAHTGSGTHLVASKEQLEQLQRAFPKRPARVSAYIKGPVFTSNNIVTASDILVGNISYQITGLAPFTDNPFATVGNDWGVVKTLLTKEQKQAYTNIVRAVGTRLKRDGWKGLFGVDIALEEKTGKLFLIEINARQPASAVYESELQRNARRDGRAVTTYEAHMAALLDIDLSEKYIVDIHDGAQIILRNADTQDKHLAVQIKTDLEKNGFHVIAYANTKHGSDLLRIQSKSSIMDHQNTMNEYGKNIVNCIEKKQYTTRRTLSGEALSIIDHYLHLPIGERQIPCPYFNNKRNRVRGGLRVLVGKGSPKEIAEEAVLIAMREKIDLATLSENALKQFCVEHSLGIDCAGLAYYILDAESKAIGIGPINKQLSFPFGTSPIRKLVTKFRPAENTSVQVFAHQRNTSIVPLHSVRPGDLIVLLDSGGFGVPNHVLLIHQTDHHPNGIETLHYTHTLRWSTDGAHSHGVRQGRIDIIDPAGTLLRQSWIEQGKTGQENETYRRAISAKILEIRRLNAFGDT